jgi:gliding motility-associated-like protein
MCKIKTKELLYLCIFLFSAKLFSQNLLTNGDFESGGSGTGFTVPNYNLYNPFSGGITPGHYAISNNPTPLNSFFIPNIIDHTVGVGNNMMVVDGSTSGGASFWSAGNNASGLCSLTVGSTYTFSYWIRTISSTTVDNTTQPNIIANFTNASGVVRIFGSQTVGLPAEDWQQVVYSFTATAACVNINLVNINLSPGGNDFVLDDLSVTLQLCPPVVLSINNPDPVCSPSTADITDPAVTLGSIGGGVLSYWTDAAGTIPLVSPPPSAINVTGTYYIRSTSGPTCSDIKAVNIVVKPLITPLFTQVPAICVGEALAPLPTISNNGVVGVWSPALDNTQTTTYTFTPETTVIPSLITNGDFSMGNTGFTTDYNFLTTTDGTTQGVYGITTNSNTWANFAATCNDHTGAGGNFMVADTNISLGGNARLWCQTVPVNAGENYIFEYFANAIVSNDPARLQVEINGVVVGTTNLSSTTCTWNQSSFSWNSGTSTIAEICIYSRNSSSPSGNDFGIDDISFKSTSIQCASTAGMTITVNPLPVLTSLTPTNAGICVNETAEFTLVGTANATVSYTINAGTAQTVVLNATGNGVVIVPTATADQVITLSAITVGTCSQTIANTATVTVNPLPVLTSLTPTNIAICANETAEFTLVGTANATVSYTINGGAAQTVVLNATGNGVVSVPTATANQLITLSAITVGTCSQTLTNTATVTVNPLPVLTSLTPTNIAICANETAEFTLVGTANATVSYTINAGVAQTVVLNATGNGVVAVPTATANQVITLSGITLGTCSQTIANTATVTVNPLPVLTSLTPTNIAICANEMAEFTLVGTANATVSYTVNAGVAQTVVLNATGNGVVAVPTATANQVITLSAITVGTCSQTLTNTATVTVNPLPVLTSLTPTNIAICANETAEFILVGTANATVSYTINAGAAQTVVLNATGNGVVIVPTATADQVITLSAITLGTCSQTIANTITVTVNPIVTPIFDPVGPICSGDFLATLPTTSLNGVTGTWTPLLNNMETTTYTFTPNNIRQCTPPTLTTLTIVVNTPLSPDFSDLFPICEGSAAPILETTSPNGITGTWSPQVISNTISGDYVFTPTTGQCASSQTLSVTVNPVTLMDVVLLAGEDFSGDGTITVNAISDGNYEYQMDDGNPQTSNIFENVSPGVHTFTVIDLYGCSNPITKEILILDYPKFFTPNGDGYNETWNIQGLEGQPNAQIYIFDRFGKLIKQIVANSEGWNGKFNGEELPSTDYWFTVDYLAQASPKQFKAHFSLKR